MKRIITSAFVILLSIGAAQAQTASTEKNKVHKEHRKGGFDGLNLSADQQAKMKSLRADFKKQSSDLKSNTQLSEADKKARRQELHKQHRDQVEAILTPSQKETLAKKKAEWKSAGKEGKKAAKRGGDRMSKGRKGGDARSAAFGKELNLTADQQAKMTQIRTDFRSKAEVLRNNSALSQDQKRTQMKELMQQQQEQVKAVLTKEQREKMKSMKKDRSARNTK